VKVFAVTSCYVDYGSGERFVLTVNLAIMREGNTELGTSIWNILCQWGGLDQSTMLKQAERLHI
jgi:hypothetical protein